MDPVRVVWRKYDGSLHWNLSGLLLGEDEHGIWVGVRHGATVHRGESAHHPAETAHVLLFPRQGWYTPHFNAHPHRTEIYVDITTVPHWPSPAEVTMVDLDLDVRRRRDGRVDLLDEDEFAAHRVKYDYPPDVVAEAEATAQWLVGAVTERVEPFHTAYRRWLDLVL